MLRTRHMPVAQRSRSQRQIQGLPFGLASPNHTFLHWMIVKLLGTTVYPDKMVFRMLRVFF